MKKILFLFVLGFALLSCGGNAKQETAAQTTQEAVVATDGVEVLYFHGKQRCATCIAIEKHAREAVEAAFADAVKRGEVTFRIIDISQPENQALAEKYEVTWSSLFVVKHQGGHGSGRLSVARVDCGLDTGIQHAAHGQLLRQDADPAEMDEPHGRGGLFHHPFGLFVQHDSLNA